MLPFAYGLDVRGEGTAADGWTSGEKAPRPTTGRCGLKAPRPTGRPDGKIGAATALEGAAATTGFVQMNADRQTAAVPEALRRRSL